MSAKELRTLAERVAGCYQLAGQILAPLRDDPRQVELLDELFAVGAELDRLAGREEPTEPDRKRGRK